MSPPVRLLKTLRLLETLDKLILRVKCRGSLLQKNDTGKNKTIQTIR